MFGNQALVVSDSFSNLFKSSWNWASDQYGKWSNYFYETQESSAIVQNPQEYFPQDIQSQMYSEIHFQEAIQTIENHFEERNWQPAAWKTTLEFYLEEVKAGRLSLLSFHRGVESLVEQLEELFDEDDNLFQRFYEHAKNEIQAKLKDKTNPENKTWIEKQFRFSIYQGLQDVLNQTMTKEGWLEELKSYSDLIDPEIYQTIRELSQEISGYIQEKNLLNQITQEELIHYVNGVESSRHPDISRHSRESRNLPKETQVVSWKSEAKSRDSDNSKLTSIQKAFNWIWDHKAEAFTFGIAATALYKSTQTQTENNFASINTLAKFAVAVGAQQIFNTRTPGISNLVLPTLFSFVSSTLLQPVNTQSNNTFFIVAGGTGDDETSSLQNTLDNGYAIVGYTNSSGAGDYDVLLSKYTSNGTFLWAKTLGGNNADYGNALQEMSDGSLVLVGQTYSFGAGNRDIFLSKWWNNGTLVWAKTLGGNTDEAGNDIKKTSDGGLLTAGGTYEFGGDILCTKWWSNGTLAWAKVLGGSGNEYATGMEQTSDNGFVMTGPTTSFNALGLEDILLTKLDANGALLWTKMFGGNSEEVSYGIKETQDNGLVVVGITNSFGVGGVGRYGVLLTKWSSNGTLEWGKTLSGSNDDRPSAVQEITDGSLIIVGWTTSFGAGNSDGFLAKFSSNGTFIWGRTLGGLSGDYVATLQQTLEGNFVIAGETNSFGAGNYDLLFTKLDANGNLVSNCSVPFTPNITDITTLLNVTNVIPTVTPWNPNVTNWNVTSNSFTPFIEYPCTPFTTFFETLDAGKADYSYAIQNTTDGGYITVGTTNSFGTGNNTDVLLSKFDGNGILMWSKALGGSGNDKAYAVQVNSLGEYVVAGTTTSFGFGGLDIFLAKFRANGTVSWARTIGSIYGYNDEINTIQINVNGELIVTGYSYTPYTTGNDILVSKWFDNGTLGWAKLLNGPGANDDVAYTLKIGSNGELLVGGVTASPRLTDPDLFLSSWFDNGTLSWLRVAGGNGSDTVSAIETTSSGNIVTISYSSTSFLSNVSASYNTLFSTWAQNGSLLSSILVELIPTGIMAITPSDELIMVGATNDPTTLNADVFLSSWTSNGTFLWAKALSNNATNQTAQALKITPAGDLVVIGISASGPLIFGVGYAGAGFGANEVDILISKWTKDGELFNCNAVKNVSGPGPVYDITDILNSTIYVSNHNVTDWSPLINIWNITERDISFSTQQSCVSLPTTAPTPNPTPASTSISTTSLATTPNNSGSPTTQPGGNSSSGGKTIPIAVGATAGAVVLLGAGIGTALFFKRRKKSKPGSKPEVVENNNIQDIELAKKQSEPEIEPESANASVEAAQFTSAIDQRPHYAKMSDVAKNQPQPKPIYANSPNLEEKTIYANSALVAPIVSSPTNQYLPFITLAEEVQKAPRIYSVHMKRDVSEKYELLNKMNRTQAKILADKVGLEITFPEGVDEAEVILGQGQFGKISVARSKQTQNPEIDEYVAVKEIVGEQAIADSQLEAQKQSKLKGLPNIMQLYDSIPAEKGDKPILYQFMPLAGFGNGEFLKQALALCEDAELKGRILGQVMYGLLTGFKGMHGKRIYHMDFKPANFVMDQWGDEFIIDFGCSIERENGLTKGATGDPRYFSPERFNSYRSPKDFEAEKSDAWSLGLTLLELALNRYPFDNCNKEEKSKNWNDAYFKEKLSKIEELQDPDVKGLWIVIKGLLAIDPKKRLNIQQALNMPVFTEVKLQFQSKEEGKKYMKLLRETAHSKIANQNDSRNHSKSERPHYQLAPGILSEGETEKTPQKDYAFSPELKHKPEENDYKRVTETGEVISSSDKNSASENKRHSNIPRQQETATQNFFGMPPVTQATPRSQQEEHLETVYPLKSEFSHQ